MSRFALCNCPAGFSAAPERHAPDCPGRSGAGKPVARVRPGLDGPSRFNPTVVSGFTDHFTVTMNRDDEGRWIKYDDHLLEMKIEKEALTEEFAKQADVLPGLVLALKYADTPCSDAISVSQLQLLIREASPVKGSCGCGDICRQQMLASDEVDATCRMVYGDPKEESNG